MKGPWLDDEEVVAVVEVKLGRGSCFNSSIKDR